MKNKLSTKKDLSKFYLDWFKQMSIIRKFETRAAQLYGQQKIKGFCHLYNGQEACIIGTVGALEKKDKYITAYRDHAIPIALGIEPKYVMAELFGKVTGISKGMGGSMHMFSKEKNLFGGHGIVGGQIPLGTGIAFAEKYNKTKNICITFLGDGAVRQGAYHESLNLAMLYKLPIIFIIENNGYAMGTSVERSSNVTKLYKTGSSYDIESSQVDGMDIEAIYIAVEKAAIKARKGLPQLLEFVTYRYKGHSISDPAKYRDKAEVNKFINADPIEKLRQKIVKKKIKTSEQLESIETKVNIKIKEAIEFAENSEWPTLDDAIQYSYKDENYRFIS